MTELSFIPKKYRHNLPTAQAESEQSLLDTALTYSHSKLTDVEYVADSLDRLRHRDMRAMCAAVWADIGPASASELADRLADWADKNRRQ